MSILFAVLLLLYAAWQIFTFAGAPNKGEGMAQIIWAVLAIAGGIYFLKKTRRK